MNPETQLKEIISYIEEGKKIGLTSNEVIINIKGVIPPEIEYIEKEPITPKSKLEYLRLWRLEQKNKNKIQLKEDRERFKIEKALKRTSFFCYNCKENIIVSNPEDNKASVVQKKNRSKKSINISNKCNKCMNKLNSFGGWV